MSIKSFHELDAWQKAHELRKSVRQSCVEFPQFYHFGLCAQMQRSSISVSSNIAEGFGRKSTKEKLRYYDISEGSLTELIDQLLLCRDLSLIEVEKIYELLSLAENVHKLIHGLTRHIRNTNSEIRATSHV